MINFLLRDIFSFALCQPVLQCFAWYPYSCAKFDLWQSLIRHEIIDFGFANAQYGCCLWYCDQPGLYSMFSCVLAFVQRSPPDISCSVQWKNRVFLVGAIENKPANLQSSCMRFSPIAFSGVLNAPSDFAGFKTQTCKAHVLSFPPIRASRCRLSWKKRPQPLPLLIRQSPKLRRARVAQMAHPIRPGLIEERTTASTARLADLRA